jgi:hypothetical protein
MTSPEIYTQLGLPLDYYQIVKTITELSTNEIPSTDVGTAYMDAKANVEVFRTAMSKLAKGLKCQHFCRPGVGIKNPDRILEKYSKSGVIPTDILGAKLIVSSLQQMYFLAKQIPRHYPVLQFKDRIVEPQRTGYRDLQFVINFKGSPVELKICHQIFDEIDSVEHKVYEITRSFQGITNIPLRQLMLLEALVNVSRTMYTQAWQEMLVTESGDR